MKLQSYFAVTVQDVSQAKRGLPRFFVKQASTTTSRKLNYFTNVMLILISPTMTKETLGILLLLKATLIS
jgi:hypothetical protein